MDYSKALFAFHVRELAGIRMARAMPKDMSSDDVDRWRLEHYEATVEGVLSEVDWTIRIIDKQGA